MPANPVVINDEPPINKAAEEQTHRGHLLTADVDRSTAPAAPWVVITRCMVIDPSVTPAELRGTADNTTQLAIAAFPDLESVRVFIQAEFDRFVDVIIPPAPTP